MIEGSALRDLGAGASLRRRRARRAAVRRETLTQRSALGSRSSNERRPRGRGDGGVVVQRCGDHRATGRGTEVAAAAIGEPLEVLPLVEIVPKDGVYDYGARYTAGATDYLSPARLEPRGRRRCDRAGARSPPSTIRSIGRVDLIVDAHGRPWVLEANVSPGMTDTSLVPMAQRRLGCRSRRCATASYSPRAPVELERPAPLASLVLAVLAVGCTGNGSTAPRHPLRSGSSGDGLPATVQRRHHHLRRLVHPGCRGSDRHRAAARRRTQDPGSDGPLGPPGGRGARERPEGIAASGRWGSRKV